MNLLCLNGNKIIFIEMIHVFSQATEAVEFPTSSNGCSLPVGTSMTTIPNSVHVPSEEVTITTATTPGSGKKKGFHTNQN